jgi:predicted transcriptional regulator
LLAISEGKSIPEIKSSIQLSRYSYDYIINRLRNHQLLKDQGEVLILSSKGVNVVTFLKENEKITLDNVAFYAPRT